MTDARRMDLLEALLRDAERDWRDCALTEVLNAALRRGSLREAIDERLKEGECFATTAP